MPEKKQTKTKPKSKKTTKTTKVKTKQKSIEVLEEKLTDDQIRIKLLKTELQYYKGLGVMIITMMFCIFIAFGSLFSAMYLEARATRMVFHEALKDFLPQEIKFEPLAKENFESEEIETEKIEQELDISDWYSFSKYGITVKFPETWTFSDDPYTKQINLFTDGVVRDEGAFELGDVVVSVTPQDNYKELYQPKLQKVLYSIIYEYELEKERVYILPIETGFVNIQVLQDDLDWKLISKLIENIVVK